MFISMAMHATLQMVVQCVECLKVGAGWDDFDDVDVDIKVRAVGRAAWLGGWKQEVAGGALGYGLGTERGGEWSNGRNDESSDGWTERWMGRWTD